MIKLEHRPVRYGEDLIVIGGTVPGIGTEIDDPDGWVWALLESLDGTRTVGQIVADLAHRFPAHPASEVREAITRLDAAGYLHEAGPALPAGRHQSALALWRWMDRTPGRSAQDVQMLLAQARVTVIGVGGAGATAALALTVAGVGQIHCVDDDVVDMSNLNRQVLYTEHDLGRPKVEVAVRRLREHNSEVQVTGARERVDGTAALHALAIGCDVLVLAADTPSEIRYWTATACQETGTAWVHGGYEGPRVSVGLYQPGTGPCHDCGQTARRHAEAAGPPVTFWSPGAGVAVTHAANVITACTTGLLAAHAAMSLITGAPPVPANGEFGWNLVRLDDSQRLGLDSPHPGCPTCG
ncbi:ThiF family adenylyltransferase [Amycolatopsis azurea]|uniref:ThiF family adenylyltransferase n=1 Tax=Amycolatopsis azurea TaxID=36819 RepID=UPI0037FD396D